MITIILYIVSVIWLAGAVIVWRMTLMADRECQMPSDVSFAERLDRGMFSLIWPAIVGAAFLMALRDRLRR